jgi:hypothetical protein
LLWLKWWWPSGWQATFFSRLKWTRRKQYKSSLHKPHVTSSDYSVCS